jgi:tricorn protease
MKMRKTIFILICLIFGITESHAQVNPLWLRYPSISPDGKNIAFSYKGDIYKVNAGGGRAVQLTSNPAHDTKPIWSPDGKQIAFSSDRFGNFDIYTLDANGGIPKRITFYSGTESPASYSPDGKYIYFSSTIQDLASNAMFPSGLLSELYRVPAGGGRMEQILGTPALNPVLSQNGNYMYYEDIKGYEDPWRKHHQSAVARDIWQYDFQLKKHRRLTNFKGEDRNPVLNKKGESVYYLTEQFNSHFNIGSFQINNPAEIKQLTAFDKHPVRFLSVSVDDLLCFSYDGEIYLLKEGEQPKKVTIEIFADIPINQEQFTRLSESVSEMSVSPDGEEIAFVIRGEIYVSSVKYNTTKQITNTPEQERSISFSPDGRSILFAGERNGSWNLYQTSLVRTEEKKFSQATLLKEEAIVANSEETFQPAYSPDGKEVAFLSERTSLKVINLQSKQIRTITDGSNSYSYADGDQWFEWSPDGKWFVVQYNDNHLFRDDIAIISSDGKGNLIPVAQSGYNDNSPRWGLDGQVIYWFTDRQGFRSHGSWGADYDIYAVFLTRDAYDKFKLNEEDFSLLENDKKKEEPVKETEQDKKKGKEAEKDKSKETKKDEIKPIVIEWDGLEDRILRLTINSSQLSDAWLDKKGEKLYYLSRFEKGFDLWEANLRKKEVKKLVELQGYGRQIQTDKKGENLFLISEGRLVKIELSNSKRTNITYTADFNLNRQAEYEYFFEHAWRQVLKKWYVTDLHQVDWNFYKNEYRKFLPHLVNNYDFAEMLSEMLGELNGSHTGARYSPNFPNGDETSKLGIFIDWAYRGNGIKIAEIMDKSPLKQAKSNATAGIIIEKINGQLILANEDFWQFFNRKANKATLFSFYDPANNKRWDEVIKPIRMNEEYQLLYERWVKNCRATVDKLSNGRLGYTHVRGMNSPSFREVYSDVLGLNAKKEGLVVDTRFNGGGWLHDDLVTLLGGQVYVTYWPRNEKHGWDPMAKWTKPSIVVMGEGNYSDAHAFPYAYKALKLGKLVGMPVPGTMTAVWWETLHDNSLVFGIPQVGSKDMNGNYLENQQLEPDILQMNEYEKVVNGEDQQLKRAVEELLKDLGK